MSEWKLWMVEEYDWDHHDARLLATPKKYTSKDAEDWVRLHWGEWVGNGADMEVTEIVTVPTTDGQPLDVFL